VLRGGGRRRQPVVGAFRSGRLAAPATGGVRAQAVGDREEEGPITSGFFADEAVALRQEDDEEILDEIPGLVSMTAPSQEAFEPRGMGEGLLEGSGGRLHDVCHMEDMSPGRGS